jgi:hypothetical protein
MARADLSSMLGRLDETESDDVGPKVSNGRPAAAPVTPEAQPVLPQGVADGSPPESASPRPSNGPLYLRLERKETRLRSDQYSALTEHARRLNRAKIGGGDRITENTLIRVAIDLLLSHSQELYGNTESELRNSVTL